ncbi:MAG TPA: potassium channel family protein [Solirubrobacteraceae bacterium]|nr:potassium channel family protein [Solirubrobacteraceae bacterium]
MSPTSLEDLDRRQQRRVIGRTAFRILVSVVLLFALYGTLPIADRTSIGTLIELLVGLIIFGAVLGWQVLKIMGAEHPELRAAEALAVAVPIVLIVFAFTYLSLSHAHPGSFSEPLDHIRSVYFVITVISTVGFGDITPKTHAAMILVSFQIMLDLVLLVGIVRAVFFAAQVGVRRRQTERDAVTSESSIASGPASQSPG